MREIVGSIFLFVGGQEGGGRLIEEEDRRYEEGKCSGNIKPFEKKINSELSLNQ